MDIRFRLRVRQAIVNNRRRRDSSESSGGDARSDPTNGSVNNMARKTGTATEDLRKLKRLKNVRKQTSISYTTILSCLGRKHRTAVC